MDEATRTISSEGPLLGLAEEKTLWKKREEPAIREELVRRHMGFARGLALAFRAGPDSTDDLVQVANLALVKAIDRYDPSREIPFRAFAAPTINGELKRHFRDRVAQVRVPRSLHERITKVDQAVNGLSADLRRSPSVSEIAEEIGTPTEEVIEAIEARQSRFTVSLETPTGAEPDAIAPAEKIGEDDETFEEVEQNLMLRAAADDLSESEKQVLRLRFREDMTQSEIADEIGYSQMHVSRILRRSIATLREELVAQAA
jgi:RNA polymerase sigma-B factor